MSEFTNMQVNVVSDFIQEFMKSNNINMLTADECSELLAKNDILPKTVGPKPGFNFRQMLRDGRDRHINLVEGASQTSPKLKWIINRID